MPNQDEMAGVAHTIVNQNEADMSEFWTSERMANAIPLPVPRMPLGGGLESGPSLEEGERIIVPPNSVSVAEKGDTAATIAQPVPNPGSWPYACVGKMFMSFGGTGYVASGWCASGSAYVFGTAGHCVYDTSTDQWATNVMFCPSYTPNGPGDKYYATKLVTLVGWATNHNFAYDIGFVVVSKSMFENRGNLGLVFTKGTGPFTAVGYPANAPFPGNQMYKATGNAVPSTTGIAMNNNDMGGGSSGGPWMINYQGQFGYVNGVQSYHNDNPHVIEHSPSYGGQGAYNAWRCAVANQC